MRQNVSVTLAGQTLNLRTEDDPRYVQSLAAYLEERIDELRRGSDKASTHKVALLAGLRVVDELFQLRRDYGGIQANLAGRVERVLSLLDEHELT